jgi:hypothetical protein
VQLLRVLCDGFIWRCAACCVLSYTDNLNMYEYFNPPSAWDSYLCTIPASFTSTAFWSSHELEKASVLDPKIQELTEKKKRQIALDYIAYIPSLTKAHPRLFPATFFTFQNFVWASAACDSRSWAIDASANGGTGAIIMVPAVDLLNHHPSSNHASYDVTVRKFSIISGPNGVSEGSEVLLSYGAKCNAQLLATYGFALQQNSVACEH